MGQQVDFAFVRLSATYLRWLKPALHHRGWVMLGAVAFFIASLGIVRFLRSEFIPSQDMSRVLVRFQTPVGSSLDATDRVFRQLETYFASRPEVLRYSGAVGGFGGGEVNTGILFVTMKDKADRPVDPKRGHRLSQQEFMADVRQVANSIPGCRANLQDISQGGFSATRGGGFPVEFNIRGRDWDTLARSTRQIMDDMRQAGGVTDVDSDYQVGMPEVQVVPNRNKAADLGISMATIGETVNSAIGGQRVGKFKDKGRRFDIRVRLLAPQRQRPEDIQRLLVRTVQGGLVRLGDIVRIEQRPTLQTITRKDRERAITIFANVAPGVSQADAIDRSLAIARKVLPDSYRAIPSGSSQAFSESFQSLGFAFALGLIVAYMVLATQFNAFSHPFTVLLALPFSISGALMALWLAGQSLNVYSLLGMILLMGIAKKNSILLVDFTNQLRAQGAERHEALLEACPLRLRPILMTSIATIAGALPPALAIGPGAELQRPMALALVGGMVVSTLLTLFVVPAAYSVLDDMIVWNDDRRKRGVGLLAGLRGIRAGEGAPAAAR
jgi:HAE1 family hydrophobic/amphiphilic exporter-1